MDHLLPQLGKQKNREDRFSAFEFKSSGPDANIKYFKKIFAESIVSVQGDKNSLDYR